MDYPTVQQLFDLSGQTALVTGGARNLGFDMALALAEAGADVVITSRTLANARKSASLIAERTGRRVLPLELDVCEEEQASATIDSCLAEFGKLDIVLANAGIAPLTKGGPRQAFVDAGVKDPTLYAASPQL